MQVVIERSAARRRCRQVSAASLAMFMGLVGLGASCAEVDILSGMGTDGFAGGDVLGYHPSLPAGVDGLVPTVGPASPSNLFAAAAGEAEIGIRLTWTDNSDNEEGFRIDRLVSGEWAEYTTVGPDVTVFTDRETALDPSYCYRVAAFNLAGTSEFASPVCASLPEVLSSPSDLLVAVADGGEIQLTWTDNSDNEEGFRIDRLTSAEWAEYATTGPDVTVFTDQEATSEISYCYRVAAFNLAGVSEFSQTGCSELDAEEAYLNAMRALPPLPKVHYSWPLERSYLLDNPDDPRLYEYIRISQAVSFCGYYATAEQVDALLRVAGQVQADHPELRIHVGVNYSPWLRVFPPDAPPTDFGPAHDAEIEMYRERMLRAKDRLAQANAAYGSNLTIDVLLLDSERFTVKSAEEPDYQAWNDAITVKNEAFYWVSKEVFPQAKVDWYPRGPGKYFTLDEVGDNFSTSAYYMPDLAKIRRIIGMCYDLAVERDDPELTIWVALGAGYAINEAGLKWWTHDKPYDTLVSWQLGAELNDPVRAAAATDLAAWSSVTTGTFYPTPFRSGTPEFPRHFLAYVRGAHGLPGSP